MKRRAVITLGSAAILSAVAIFGYHLVTVKRIPDSEIAQRILGTWISDPKSVADSFDRRAPAELKGMGPRIFAKFQFLTEGKFNYSVGPNYFVPDSPHVPPKDIERIGKFNESGGTYAVKDGIVRAAFADDDIVVLLSYENGKLVGRAPDDITYLPAK